MVSGTYVERDLFESKAYLSLKGFAPQLLILMLGKRKFNKIKNGKKNSFQCTNNHHISFTYKEAQEKYGLTIPRFIRAIDDLLEKGFIKIEHSGGGIEGDKTIYALSNSYLLWKEGSVLYKRETYSVKRGFCNPKDTL